MIFARDDSGTYVPTPHARGPWSPDALHGGAPSALLTGAVERLAPGMHLARLTVEFLGEVPMAPLQLAAEIVKPGRRFQLAEATLAAGGRDVLRARAVLLRSADLEDVPAGTAPAPLDGGPGDAVAATWAAPGPEEGFHLTGMEIRFASGSFAQAGPAVAWFRMAHPLVDGEEPSPVQRAVGAADFGNGVSSELDWTRWLFVNTDLTVLLHRPPRGAWVALDARTTLERSGVGLATSTLHDEHGPIGMAHQSLFLAPR